jgi:phospholipid/cholesterol/gamma-HCH transport system substrate-binding protein
MFGSTFRAFTVFREVNGLQEGNNVRYSGINVGTVDEIVLRNDTSIVVWLVLEKKMKGFIRKNSVASVGTDGLMGNKLVNIAPGSVDAPLIAEGGEIPSEKSVDTEAMLRTLEFTNQNIAFVSANLKDITERINKNRGTLYTVLMDTTLASTIRSIILQIESVSNNLNKVTNDLTGISGDLKHGNGVIGLLLRDTTMKNDLQSIVMQVKNSSEKFQSITTEAEQIMTRVNKGNGAISTLLNDSSLSKDIKQSLINIQSSSRKLDANLEALKNSFLFRGYFKKQEKLKKKEDEKK